MTCLILDHDQDLWYLLSPKKYKNTLGLTPDKFKSLIQETVQKDNKIIGGALIQEKISDHTQNFLKDLTESLNMPFFHTSCANDLEKQCIQMYENFIWNITYYGYPKGKKEYAIESLLTVGNGYLGLRGTTPEMRISDNHYPGSYIAGLYNQATSIIEEQPISNEDFVNAPNFQEIYIVVDGVKIDIEHNNIRSFIRNLDLKSGIFTSKIIIDIEDKGYITIHTSKLVSMHARHFYGISYSFTTSFDADISIYSVADGSTYNYNVQRYRNLENKHLDIINMQTKDNEAYMISKTKQSDIYIHQASQLNSLNIDLSQSNHTIQDNKMIQKIKLYAKKNKEYSLEKIVYTKKSFHNNFSNSIDFPNFNSLKNKSISSWNNLWSQAHIQITGDLMSQKLLNINTYHLLVSASPNGNKDLDASVTARGLHGEAYRGHIFWDELFILPFYILHFPNTAKQLLLYRFHRLDMAKKMAKQLGLNGAMFPWQSGLDGSEQSQRMHLNPLNGQWKEDNSHRQRHVSLAIAYNIWLYVHVTQDKEFLIEYGSTILQEIMRFWLSLTIYDDKTQRYHIHGIMGPDEFHEAYPDAKEYGLTDNAYTNIMVLWLIQTLKDFQRDNIMFNFSSKEWSKMEEISQKLYIEIHDHDIIAQYSGYLNLKEIDWKYYKNKYQNIYRMDRILNAEGKSADHYQVAKQADTLMIFYNLPIQQVTQLLHNLGYSMNKNYMKNNFDYYLARTSHGSTLSRIVHAQLATITKNQSLAWELYQEALASDYYDIQGGTTAEGIHTGVMAASLYVTMTAFAGMDIRKETLSFYPQLPKQWSSLSFNINYQEANIDVKLTHKEFMIKSSKNLDIVYNGQLINLTQNKIICLEA